MITDTKLGKWAYRGWLSLIGEADGAGKEETGMETATVSAETLEEGSAATAGWEAVQ